MKKVIASTLLAFAVAAICNAQSINAVKSRVQSLVDGDAPTAKTVAINTDDQYAAQVENARIAANTAARVRLLSRSREIDPFGAPLNTPLPEMAGVKASEPTTAKMQSSPTGAQSPEEIAAALFLTAINTMQVNAVNAARREFLIGADNFYEGDAIDMQYKGQLFRAWVKEVTPNHVVLIDQKTRTVCDLKFNTNEMPLVRGAWGARGTVSGMPNY